MRGIPDRRMQVWRQRASRAFLGLLAAVLHPALGRSEELPKLTIGYVLPLSGAQADYGKEAELGLTLAHELLTSQDADLGHRIKLVAGDDQSTPAGAEAAMAVLIDKERSQVVIGSLTQATTAAAVAVARQRQLTFIVPFTTAASLGMGGGVFRACLGEAAQGGALAHLARSVLGITKVALLREDSLQSKAMADRFTAAWLAGGSALTADVTYPLGAAGFAAPLGKVAAAGAVLVATPAPLHAAAPLLAEARKTQSNLRFLGLDSWDTPAFYRLLGPSEANAAAGHFHVSQFAEDDPDAATVAFIKAFQAKFGRAPTALSALTFDAFNLTVDAFKRARSSAHGPLTAAVERTNGLAGATGTITFGDNSGEPRKSAIIKETGASGGKFKTRLLPEAVATK